MTGLLVSVRNAQESLAAVAGGADVIDVKEPRRGALGAADEEVWRAVRGVLPAELPFSIALGELADRHVVRRAARTRSLAQLQFAKVGLANCLAMAGWQRRWRQALDQLPPHTRRVAVAYADHSAAGAPAPRDVLRAAPAAGCHTLLLDTYSKSEGDLFDHLGDDEVARLARDCREAGVALALAGSLRLTSIARALHFAPQLIAVRGAACSGGRNGSVCAALVKRLKQRMRMNLEQDLISN